METIKKWTIKELKEKAISLNQLIYKIGCYGCRDLAIYDFVLSELDKRGYIVDEHNIKFIKK